MEVQMQPWPVQDVLTTTNSILVPQLIRRYLESNSCVNEFHFA